MTQILQERSGVRVEGVSHEAIWGPIGGLVLLTARFFPFDRISLGACPFRALTGIPCLSCGGTRSLMAFTRLDLGEAFAMNPLVAALGFIAAAYLAYAVGVWVFGLPRWRPSIPSARWRNGLRLAAVSALVLNWTYLIAAGR